MKTHRIIGLSLTLACVVGWAGNAAGQDGALRPWHESKPPSTDAGVVPVRLLTIGGVKRTGKPLRPPKLVTPTQREFFPHAQPQPAVLAWEAPGSVSQALYFEEVNLERHGFSHLGPYQPLGSAAHFFGNVLLLPYKMAARPHCCVESKLGHYRPGSCVPYRPLALPKSHRTAAVQAAAVAGLVFLIP